MEDSDKEEEKMQDTGEERNKELRIQQETSKEGTFIFQNEDHTLGNLLRNVLLKNKDMELAAYTVPHPSESLMNVRVQVTQGTARDALSKGLLRITKICDVVLHKYEEALLAYNDQSQNK